MLPRINAHGGRRGAQEFVHAVSCEPHVVALPKLRLLKQVEKDAPALPPLPVTSHVVPQPRRPLSRNGPGPPVTPGACARPGSGSEPPARGRGLLRPLRSGKGRPPVRRSLSPLPRYPADDLVNKKASALERQEENDINVAHQIARERVREELRQKKRLERKEEERRQQEEKERLERAQQAMPEIEAHRRKLARRAAEQHRRLAADKDSAMHEQEEEASARREKARKYRTPSQIRQLVGQRQDKEADDSPRERKSESCGEDHTLESRSRGRQRHASHSRAKPAAGHPCGFCFREYYKEHVSKHVGAACWESLHAAFVCGNRHPHTRTSESFTRPQDADLSTEAAIKNDDGCSAPSKLTGDESAELHGQVDSTFESVAQEPQLQQVDTKPVHQEATVIQENERSPSGDTASLPQQAANGVVDGDSTLPELTGDERASAQNQVDSTEQAATPAPVPCNAMRTRASGASVDQEAAVLQEDTASGKSVDQEAAVPQEDTASGVSVDRESAVFQEDTASKSGDKDDALALHDQGFMEPCASPEAGLTLDNTVPAGTGSRCTFAHPSDKS